MTIIRPHPLITGGPVPYALYMNSAGDKTMTRVNFGNGQVWAVASVAAGKRYIAECAARGEAWVSSFRVQRYAGDGEWVNVK